MVKVKDIMTSRVISIESRKTIGDALELMVENGIRRLRYWLKVPWSA